MMFIVEYVKQPIYITEDLNFIHMLVKFKEFPEEVSYIAAFNDPEEHGRQLYTNAVAGKYGAVAPFRKPVET